MLFTWYWVVKTPNIFTTPYIILISQDACFILSISLISNYSISKHKQLWNRTGMTTMYRSWKIIQKIRINRNLVNSPLFPGLKRTAILKLHISLLSTKLEASTSI